jgi:acyl-CoA dehydrogenase
MTGIFEIFDVGQNEDLPRRLTFRDMTFHARQPLAGLDGFRDEVRRFFDAELTPELRQAGRETTGVHSEIGACRAWHGRLYRKGWIAPAWPKAFGGTGWSHAQRFLFEQECARNDAPVLFAGGLRSIGPLIIARGSEEQRRRYLPAILSGADLWAQGFSETGAGSDLAALQTRAVNEGDHYVVTGRKLWTTGAHLSNRMFALVRTRKGNRPQEGITFLLIDLPSPGLSIKPIVTLEGEHEFNEVILDEVRVPVENRVGQEDEGWDVAKHLMRLARTNNTNSSLLRRTWRAVERAARPQRETIDICLKLKMAAVEAELLAFEALEFRLLATERLSGDDEQGSSLMKVTTTELHQRITELLLALAGPSSLYASHALGSGDGFAMRKYLATRAASIYSGTSEIHRNVIGRHLLS